MKYSCFEYNIDNKIAHISMCRPEKFNSMNRAFWSELPELVDKISKNLRCLICQGQSVYDSQSDFALSMKTLIKNKLEEGKSEKQIYDYLKNQYGAWIVYDPEFDKKNLLLWTFPLILFIFGGLLIYRKVFIN